MPRCSERQVGLNHLAFMIESLDDLKDALLPAEGEGVKFDHIYPIMVCRSASISAQQRQWARSLVRTAARESPQQDSVFAPEVVNLGPVPRPWEDATGDAAGGVNAPEQRRALLVGTERRSDRDGAEVPGPEEHHGAIRTIGGFRRRGWPKQALAHDLVAFVRRVLSRGLAAPCGRWICR